MRRILGGRTQAKIARIVEHLGGEMIDDLGIVYRRFQQRSIEDRFVLIGETLSDLLTHTRAFQSQVLICESLLGEFEDVPLTAIEPGRLGVITNLHRTEEIRYQLLRKVVVLEILFRGESDIAATAKSVDVFTLGARNGCEVCLALKLLIDVIDLRFRSRRRP